MRYLVIACIGMLLTACSPNQENMKTNRGYDQNECNQAEQPCYDRCQ